MSTADNCKCGGYGCAVCDPEAVALADAGVRLAEQPQAMAGYVRVLARLAMDWDERLMSDERSACQAGAAALTILIAKTSRASETPATLLGETPCRCPCGCDGMTIAPGRCMVCRVRESCRKRPGETPAGSDQ